MAVVKNKINFPLESLNNSGLMTFTISSESLSRAISLMPEHTAIGVMRNALIDAFVAPPTQIRLDFQHFNSNYSIMHTMLMGDEASTYSSYYSFNRQDYQALYKSKLDILLSTTVIYTVSLKDSFANTIGGFNPFSSNVFIEGNQKYKLTANPARKNISISITQNDGSVSRRYSISNKYLFFTSKPYLASSSHKYGVNQNPEYKSRTIFSILDILKTN